MPAVIQRLFTAKAGEMPVTQWARRVDDMFAGHLWQWTGESAEATVFPSYELADAQARELGAGCYPVVRPARADVTERTDRTDVAGAVSPEPARAAAVHGVSPSQMAAGDTKARIAAARQNRRVTALRRTAADWQRVYEATCARLGEHDDE